MGEIGGKSCPNVPFNLSSPLELGSELLYQGFYQKKEISSQNH